MTSRTILITGAGTGIGRDTASALVARGHTVYATTHSESEVAGLQQALGAAATVVKLDITSAEDRARIADLDVDVLINNAAVARSGSLAEVDIDTVRASFEVNVFSTLALSQLAIKGMIERGGGSVIFISSIAGRVPFPFLMPYSMTKFALSAAAAGLRKEMEALGKGIHVSVVEPGPYSTGFNQRLNDSRFEWMERESLFSKAQVEKLKAAAARELRLAETGSTKSIVRKIVAAAEARKPRLRYVAPWHFALFVRVMRILGA